MLLFQIFFSEHNVRVVSYVRISPCCFQFLILLEQYFDTTLTKIGLTILWQQVDRRN